MIVFPAIDLRRGRVVRLLQGRAEDETIYGDDPVQIARRWQSQGAEWLHVVNLDGAFGDDTADNLNALENIMAAVTIPVEFGGGLRNLDSVQSAYSLGVSRVVIGTGAIENPELLSDVLARFGSETIAVGIDARDGLVATHGWRALSALPARDLAIQVAERGITRVIYTDIARDGMLHGIDAEGAAELARVSGLRVIASGGVATLRDVQTLLEHESDGIEGVIIGQALYSGAVKLKEAIDAGKANNSLS